MSLSKSIFAICVVFGSVINATIVNAQDVDTHSGWLICGPGPVLSGSVDIRTLPPVVLSFLKKYYPDEQIKTCTKNYVKDEIDLSLVDGTRMLFSPSGKIIQIVAGNQGSLPLGVLETALPSSIRSHLEAIGVLTNVHAVKNYGDGDKWLILLNDVPPRLIYSIDGMFIEMAG